MKKIGLGQTITVLANVGVIASIVFLALQVNQNNSFLRADARYRVMQNRQVFPSEMLGDPELMIAYERSLAGEDLSDIEKSRLNWLYSRMWNSVAWEYEQYQAGLIPVWPMERHREVISQDEIARSSYLQAVDEYRDWAPDFYDFIIENTLLPE